MIISGMAAATVVVPCWKEGCGDGWFGGEEEEETEEEAKEEAGGKASVGY